PTEVVTHQGHPFLPQGPFQGVQCFPEGALTVEVTIADEQPQCQPGTDDLPGVDELFHGAYVDVVVSEGEHVHVTTFDAATALAGGVVHRRGVHDPGTRQGEFGVGALPG